MTEQTIAVDDGVFGDEQATTVTFELSHDADGVLFSGVASQLYDQAIDGHFHGPTVHLYQQLANQRTGEHPWDEPIDTHRYEIDLTSTQYQVLTKIVGQKIADLLQPDEAAPYQELADAWGSITEQMTTETAAESHRTFDEFDNEPSERGVPTDPDIGSFKCFMYNGNVAVYEHEGDQWYRCTICDEQYAELDGEHACLN